MGYIPVALKSVSPSPSSAAAGASGASGASSSPGVAGLLGSTGAASANAPAAPANAGASGQTGAQAGGAGGFNFLQMLTQTSAKGPAAKADVTSANASTAAKTADDGQADPVQPDPVAMALALVAQSMAAAQQSQGPAAAAKGTSPASADGSDAASAGAVGAAGPVSGAAGSTQGVDGSAAAGSSGLSMQNLISLLTEADSDSEPALHEATKPDPTASAPANSDSSGGSSTSGPSSANPHMSVGSHFALQHAAADAPTPAVKSPVGTSAWADELGGKITWMAHQGIDSASLRLSPEHLGPVEVRISVQDGATSVMFGAAHADTRAAIEQALPRLREMFATQGLTLTDAGVSREPPKQQSKPSQVGALSAISAAAEDGPSASSALRVRLGLLDTYA